MKKSMSIAALLLIFSVSALAQRSYTVVAHRGGANLGCENTLSCIAAGISAGADMVEVDVHLSADGEVVVSHDHKLDRMTDTTGLISEMTLEQIKSAHIVDPKTGEVTDETIPTLREVMDLVQRECSVLIEIKRKKKAYPNDGIEQKVVDIINEYDAGKWTIIQSFDDSVLENTHQIDSTLRLQKLIVLKCGVLAIDNTLSKFKFENYDYCEAVNPDYRFATKAFIKKAHAAGKKVGVWTINERKQVDKLLPGNAEEPVDMVITNSPDLF